MREDPVPRLEALELSSMSRSEDPRPLDPRLLDPVEPLDPFEPLCSPRPPAVREERLLLDSLSLLLPPPRTEPRPLRF